MTDMWERQRQWIERWSDPDPVRRMRIAMSLKVYEHASEESQRKWIAYQFGLLGEVGFWSPEWKKDHCQQLNQRLRKLDEAREYRLANEYPDLWGKYQAFSSRWDCAGIYMLEKPTFERWMEGVQAKVKPSVQELIDASKEHCK